MKDDLKPGDVLMASGGYFMIISNFFEAMPNGSTRANGSIGHWSVYCFKDGNFVKFYEPGLSELLEEEDDWKKIND